jgi:hypothetical protein
MVTQITEENSMGRAEEIFSKIEIEGIASIDKFIRDRVSEELYLDYKRVMNDGDSDRLHENDRANFAKCISGFGNSEGGIIVWGVDCSRDDVDADVAKAKFPIKDIARFKSWLEAAVSGCTIPPHGQVRHILVSQDQNVNEGFVISLIPKSNHAPLQSLNMKGGKQPLYYIRAGSGFIPAPHAVLAGMFGRRPQPKISHFMDIFQIEKINNETLLIKFGIRIVNDGPGIADDIYATISFEEMPGSNCAVRFPGAWDGNVWQLFQSHNQCSFVGTQSFRLPPFIHFNTEEIELKLIPPFNKRLNMHIISGCRVSPSFESNIICSNIALISMYKNLMGTMDMMTESEKEETFVNAIEIHAPKI